LISRNGFTLSGGNISRFGVVIGALPNLLILSINNTPSGAVNLSTGFDVGAGPAFIFSNAVSSLGPLTTIAGGTLTANTGLSIPAGRTLAGFGVISAGLTNSGTLSPATAGGNLNLTGDYTHNRLSERGSSAPRHHPGRRQCRSTHRCRGPGRRGAELQFFWPGLDQR
jgi:hypothetical protein